MTGIGIVAALWLVIAPFVFAFGSGALWSNIIAAVVTAGLLLYASMGASRFWGVLIVGLYVGVSAFFFSLDTVPLWLNVIAGAILVVVGYLGARGETTTRATA